MAMKQDDLEKDQGEYKQILKMHYPAERVAAGAPLFCYFEDLSFDVSNRQQ